MMAALQSGLDVVSCLSLLANLAFPAAVVAAVAKAVQPIVVVIAAVRAVLTAHEVVAEVSLIVLLSSSHSAQQC
jgi:hypothetical protein